MVLDQVFKGAEIKLAPAGAFQTEYGIYKGAFKLLLSKNLNAALIIAFKWNDHS
jgi:hypothetical protein